jgi:DNA-directed RNA polymerase subunit RPC12/RpoP
MSDPYTVAYICPDCEEEWEKETDHLHDEEECPECGRECYPNLWWENEE